ncbi:MAG: HDOD domain-containing protein [Desulfovibrio sp.]|jgi:HD-like signal output (HDOD) protein|nr:HDOD domain-containing protein [Desulfovibrio sp.]
MNAERLKEARLFFRELVEKPPQLPYEATLLPQLFAATREGSSASLGDLTALIERSQKLATKVLSIANSAVYALESTVTSLQRAVALLGLREVRSIIIMISTLSAIKSPALPAAFDSVRLWKHQLRAALIAKTLAAALIKEAATKELPQEDRLLIAPDEAYAAGLLHDIGMAFLAAGRPKVWQAIEDMRVKENIAFVEAEDAYWGMDHAVIGAQVLSQWKLPRLLTDPINWHHAAILSPSFTAEAKLLSAADHIAHHGLGGNGELPEQAAALMPEKADVLLLGQEVKRVLAESPIDAMTGMAE